MKRILGNSGIEVSAVGLGGWAIGGPWQEQSNLGGKVVSMGEVDDSESFRAITKAIDLGINFFDTAEGYGNGHSEKILGKAFKGKRDRVVVATKVHNTHDDDGSGGKKVSPARIRRACEESLKRLDTDYIDLYQLHNWFMPLDEAEIVFQTMDALVQDGLIRSYDWSTDHPEAIDFLVHRTNSTAIQFQFNVFIDADRILDLCEKYNLAGLCRSPLGMGLLSGKFNENSRLNPDDFRGNNIDWMFYFKDGKPNPEFLKKLDAVKSILTSQGRNPVQGSLAWIWAKSGKTIPIPGFRTEKQVEEIARAMEFGPLTGEQVKEIDGIIGKVNFDGKPVG